MDMDQQTPVPALLSRTCRAGTTAATRTTPTEIKPGPGSVELTDYRFPETPLKVKRQAPATSERVRTASGGP